MSIYATQPLTLGAVHTYPLASRKSKVNLRDFAKLPASNASLARFLDSLPGILAASDLRNVLAAILRARRIVGVMLAKEAGRAAIRPGLAPASRSDTLSPLHPVTTS